MPVLYYESTDDAYTEADQKAGRGTNGPVNEQHPLPTQLGWKSEGEDEFAAVDEAHGLPVQVQGTVPVDSRLILTPYVEVPGVGTGAAYGGTVAAPETMGKLGMFSVDEDGNPLPKKGVIVGADLLDRDYDTLAPTVHIFRNPVTLTADNAAWSPLVLEGRELITAMGFDDGADEITYKLHEILVWNKAYSSPTRRLYFGMSTAGTPTIAAGATPFLRLHILPMA